MFTGKTWAAAFINSLEKDEEEIQEGVNVFTALASWAASLPNVVFGRAAAEKLEPLIRRGISATGTLSHAQETAIRFFLLLVRKNAIHHIDSVIGEIKKNLDKQHGIIAVSAEYAFKPEKEFETRVIEAIKSRTGATRVELTGQVNPELIGGYRLRVGDEIIDASVRCQLRIMEASLASGLPAFSK